MLTKIYPVLYLLILASAIFWYYLNSEKKKTTFPKMAFLILSVVYIPVVLLNMGSIFYKLLFVMLRDFGILFILVILTNIFLKRKAVFITYIIGLVVATVLFFFGILKNTFVFNKGLDSKGELLIDIKNEQQLDKIKTSMAEYNLSLRKAFPNAIYTDQTELDDYYVIDIPDEVADKLDDIVEGLNAAGVADWIEENELVKLDPIDGNELAQSGTKFGLNDPMIGQQWGFDAMQVKELYELLQKRGVTASKKAKIAILDTGVDSGHEDLKGNFVSTDTKYNSDVHGHGTHCAGIAGAVSNNSKGIASFSPDNTFIQITSVKVLGDQGGGTQQSIISGIIEAANNGADVISLSLGGYSNDKKQTAYNEAIKYANRLGAIIVVAAGNENDNAIHYAPANCEGVITVSAIDSDLNRASFSNEISEIKMAVAAPGVNIMSTLPGNKYDAWNGTSMATPYVAGLLGLMKAVKPNLTTAQAYSLLSKNGKDTKSTKETGKLIMPLQTLQAMK